MRVSRSRVVQHPREHELFCAHLRLLRATYGFTQAKVAQGLNLSRPQYNALESGRSMLTFDHLCSLAQFYKLELFELTAQKT